MTRLECRHAQKHDEAISPGRGSPCVALSSGSLLEYKTGSRKDRPGRHGKFPHEDGMFNRAPMAVRGPLQHSSRIPGILRTDWLATSERAFQQWCYVQLDCGKENIRFLRITMGLLALVISPKTAYGAAKQFTMAFEINSRLRDNTRDANSSICSRNSTRVGNDDSGASEQRRGREV